MAKRTSAIFTGASSGFGCAVSDRLTGDGYKLFGTSRTDPAMRQLSVTDPQSCDALVASIMDKPVKSMRP